MRAARPTTVPEARAALIATLNAIKQGCYAVNRPGLSWTIDRSLAERFPKMTRYSHPGERAILRIGVVSRDRVILKLDRKEQEIIAPYVRVIEEVQL